MTPQSKKLIMDAVSDALDTPCVVVDFSREHVSGVTKDDEGEYITVADNGRRSILITWCEVT